MRRFFRIVISFLLILIISFASYVVYYNKTRAKRDVLYKEVIQKELNESGKLVVLEGSTQYKITKEETKNLFGTGIEIGNKTVAMDLQFNYGYSVDLPVIKVDVTDSIILTVENNTVKLDYLYLDVNHSYIESSASLLMKSYTPHEINEIQSGCIESVRKDLMGNTENITKAKSSLENQIKPIVNKITSKPVIIRYQ